jgi:4-carboxymuconolactone decarboxylase
MTAPPEPELRLSPRPFADWDDAARAALLPFLRRPELYLSGAPDAPPMPVVLELFANHLPLSESWLPFTEMLAGEHATLDAAHRELAILRVAYRTRSGYEWRQHRRMGGEAGLNAEQLEAVPLGPAAEVWTPLERSLLQATDEMIDQFMVGDETWSALAAHFGPAQILELLFLIGGYLCLAGVLNSVGLEPGLPDDPAEQ